MKNRDPSILHLSSFWKEINIKMNSIKDAEKMKLLKTEINQMMTDFHNTIKTNNIKYVILIYYIKYQKDDT